MASSESRPHASASGSADGNSSSIVDSRDQDSDQSSSSNVGLGDDSYGSAVISGPYRVGNSDADTCSYHAAKEGESCRKPRTCYECLNADVAGVEGGCLLAPSGFCEDMSSYEANLDYRRNTTGEDLALTGWYNYYPSVNATYCEPADAACVLCDELVNNGSLGHSSHRRDKSDNTSTEVERQFCVGADGCVCVMSCETDNWEANMPAECDANGSQSANNDSSTDATTYSTMLIFYLVLQVALLAIFMYRRGLCKRMGNRPPPVRAEGPYNNVNAITSPSNRLRLSGWRKMQNSLIEKEKKQLANHQPQYMMSPRVDGVVAQAGATDINPQQSPADSSPRSDSSRAAYAQVQDSGSADSSRERNCSVSSDREIVDQVADDIVVVGASYEERVTGSSVETSREERTSSTCAMLEARRDAV